MSIEADTATTKAAAPRAMPRFHLAFPILDKEETRQFYRDVLGCGVGREAEAWIDFDLWGHQISAHVKPDECAAARTNSVDGDAVPVRHFGAILEWDDWAALRDRLQAAGVTWIIEPKIRFQGEPGEQGTMFCLDPSGNALEFKTFKSMESVFAT